MDEKPALSFKGLKKLYYPGLIFDAIELQYLRNDVISANDCFKACIRCLGEHLGGYAPEILQNEKWDPQRPGKKEVFYAPAVELASLLHQAGWNTFRRRNQLSFRIEHRLPAKIENLAQYGREHLDILPFKELIAEAEKSLGIGGKGR